MDNGASWITLPPQTEMLYLPVVAKKDSGGLYRVRFVNGNGYTLSREAKLIVTGQDQSSSVKEENSSFDLAISPSPARDEIKITFNVRQNAELSVSDILGKMVLQEKITENGEHTLRENISGLAPGVYIARLSSGNSVRSVRFIKE
jgi:hypothetical protein